MREALGMRFNLDLAEHHGIIVSRQRRVQDA